MTIERQTYRTVGHTYHEMWLTVPLAPTDPTDLRTIEVFAREVVRDSNSDAPRLVFFQGGPGSRAQRPEDISGWLDRALDDFRVVLFDQRGTGLSTPADAQHLADLAPPAQAEYLSHFRAPNIVADAEALRLTLGEAKWSALGQSYGGFIITTYLSQAPEGLTNAYITAGLPPLTGSADDVYRLTYPQTLVRNLAYFERYPWDRRTCGLVARHLADTEELLPTGERLTPERFQQVGIQLGSASGFDALHYLLEDPFTTVRGMRRLREHVLVQLGQQLTFALNPLYWVMHESIYGQTNLPATNWAAHRVRGEFDLFARPPAELGEEFVFVGEHMFPWQGDQDPALVPLREAAVLLATKNDWDNLYDTDVLAENTVPVAAAIYRPDMFVPASSQLATADKIAGLRTVVSETYHHDGLRVDGARIFSELVTEVPPSNAH
jgi:pimeloyl-ACP methyl ester carboxylesterase